jgi:hypothetical protein
MLDRWTLECERARPSPDDEEFAARPSAGSALDLDCAALNRFVPRQWSGRETPTASAHRWRDRRHLALALQSHGAVCPTGERAPSYEALYAVAVMNAIRWTGEICSDRCCNSHRPRVPRTGAIGTLLVAS